MRVYERQRWRSTHPATLWLDDGDSFPIDWLATRTPRTLLDRVEFLPPQGSWCKHRAWTQGFFSRSFHIGDAIYYPFISDFVVFDDSHFTSWHFQNLNTYFYCYWVIYNVLMSNSNLWSLLKGHSTNVLSRAFWIKIFSGDDSKHP